MIRTFFGTDVLLSLLEKIKESKVHTIVYHPSNEKILLHFLASIGFEKNNRGSFLHPEYHRLRIQTTQKRVPINSYVWFFLLDSTLKLPDFEKYQGCILTSLQDAKQFLSTLDKKELSKYESILKNPYIISKKKNIQKTDKTILLALSSYKKGIALEKFRNIGIASSISYYFQPGYKKLVEISWRDFLKSILYLSNYGHLYIYFKEKELWISLNGN